MALDDGTSTTYPAISSSFFYAPHDHWHYLNFDRYSLRRDGDGGSVAADQKQGFCLGDRYNRVAGGDILFKLSAPLPLVRSASPA